MNISISFSPKEKILSYIMLMLHLFFLGFMVELFFYILQIPVTNAELNIILFISAFIITIAFFYSFLWKNLKNFPKDKKKSLYGLLGGFGLFYVLNLFVVIIVNNLSPDHINANNENIAQITHSYYTPMLICTVLLVPITEEVLYRGLLFQQLWQKNRILGYVVSVGVFALIHVVDYIGKVPFSSIVISTLQYLPASIALAYAYEKTDSIWTPIAIHAFINLIGMLGMR